MHLQFRSARRLHEVPGVLRHGGSLILSTEEVVPAFLASGLVNYIILTPGDAERIAQRCDVLAEGVGPQVDLIGAKASAGMQTLIRRRIGQRIFVRYATNETSIIADTNEHGIEVLVPGTSVRIVDAADVEVPVRPERTDPGANAGDGERLLQ